MSDANHCLPHGTLVHILVPLYGFPKGSVGTINDEDPDLGFMTQIDMVGEPDFGIQKSVRARRNEYEEHKGPVPMKIAGKTVTPVREIQSDRLAKLKAKFKKVH